MRGRGWRVTAPKCVQELRGGCGGPRFSLYNNVCVREFVSWELRYLGAKPGTPLPLPFPLAKRLGIQLAIPHKTTLKEVHCVAHLVGMVNDHITDCFRWQEVKDLIPEA